MFLLIWRPLRGRFDISLGAKISIEGQLQSVATHLVRFQDDYTLAFRRYPCVSLEFKNMIVLKLELPTEIFDGDGDFDSPFNGHLRCWKREFDCQNFRPADDILKDSVFENGQTFQFFQGAGSKYKDAWFDLVPDSKFNFETHRDRSLQFWINLPEGDRTSFGIAPWFLKDMPSIQDAFKEILRTAEASKAQDRTSEHAGSSAKRRKPSQDDLPSEEEFDQRDSTMGVQQQD